MLAWAAALALCLAVAPSPAGAETRQGIKLTGFAVQTPRGAALGRPVKVSFTLTNVSSAKLTFGGDFGVFVGARWRGGGGGSLNRDFGHRFRGHSLAPGQSLTLTASLKLDMPGQWVFWPGYRLNEHWGPFRDQAKRVNAAVSAPLAKKPAPPRLPNAYAPPPAPKPRTNVVRQAVKPPPPRPPAPTGAPRPGPPAPSLAPPPDRTKMAAATGTRLSAVVPGIYSPGGGGGGRTIVMYGGRRLPIQIFPPDNPWNQDISKLPVHPMSDTYVGVIGKGTSLKADFGSGVSWKILGFPLKKDKPFGIPFVVVRRGQPKVPVRFRTWGESDPGPYPVPPDAPIEKSGDRHVLVLDYDAKKLYEIFEGRKVAWGWDCGSGAVFDLNSNLLRPLGWTSADAAGLPIFPGLVRYEEAVLLGEIRHALRFTVTKSDKAYCLPATHHASDVRSHVRPFMGMRVRLKASFDVSGFPKVAQVILRALKKYGMLLSDNGGDWFLSGAPHPKWDDDKLKSLGRVKGRDFEVVYTGKLRR